MRDEENCVKLNKEFRSRGWRNKFKSGNCLIIINFKMAHVSQSKTQLDRKSKQVYVSVEGQAHRTFAVTLQGSETLPEIKTKVQTQLGLPEHTFTLTSQGAPLRLTHVKQDATLRVCLSGGLRGGSDKRGQYGRDSKEHQGNTTIAIIEFEGRVPYNVKKDCKFGDMQRDYAKEHPPAANQKYVFLHHDGSQITEEEMSKNISEIVRDKTKKFKVIIESKKTLKAEEAFLQMIPQVNDPDIRKDLQVLLKDEQKKLMTMFDRDKTNDQAEEEAQNYMVKILNVLNEQQTEKILNDLLHTNKDETLKFLMQKHNKWSKISQTMLNKSSDEYKDMQIRAFLGSKTNSYQEKKDELFTNLIVQHESKFRIEILNSLSTAQLVELFMQVLYEGQFTDFFRILKSNDVRKFWKLLKKERRLNCYEQFDEGFKIDFVIGVEYLDSDLKSRLWDNIEYKGHEQFWEIIKKVKNNAGQTSKKLQEKLVEQLTIRQGIHFWYSMAEKDEQEQLLEIVQKADKVKEFWTELDYKRRCLMIEQLSLPNLEKFFKGMNLEDRTQLITMVDEDTRKKLEETLEDYEKNELFFYEHFTMKEKTDYKPNKFVENLLKNYYDKNNQEVPFEKIDDGFVQVIRYKTGFITVQVVKPKFKTSNHVFEIGKDILDTNLESDEAREAGILTKESQNDTFRLCQNSYGQLAEEAPVSARNATTMAIISFIDCFDRFGILCTHAFFVPNPIVFSDSQQTIAKTVLFTGKNDDIFFFSGEMINKDDCEQDQRTYDIQLQILLREVPITSGEAARDIQDNCISTKIPRSSKLDAFVREAHVQLETLPNITSHQGRQYLAFSHESNTYLFDSVMNKEVVTIKNTIAFIDLVSNPNKDKKDVAAMTCLKNQEDRAKKDAYLVSVSLVTLGVPKLKAKTDKGEESVTTPEQGEPEIMDYPLECRLPEELKNMQIVSTKVSSDTGAVEAFIMLIKNKKALTISLANSFDAQKRKDQEDYAASKSVRSKKSRDKSVTQASKGTKATKSSQVQQTETKNIETFGQKKEGLVYRCKYEVPLASEIVEKETSPEEKKIYLQVYPVLQLENIGSVNENKVQHTVLLYDVTDFKIRNNKVNTIPQEQRYNFPICVDEKIPAKKLLRNLTPVPILFREEAIIGGSLYRIETNNHQKVKLQWFEQSQNYDQADFYNPIQQQLLDQEDDQVNRKERIIKPISQQMKVDYPLMVYKGFAPDNRELVLVNLADKNQPQKIVNLFNLQFICFVGHSFATREARVGFLAFDKQFDINLCWITNSKPFKKNSIQDMTDYSLDSFPIPFDDDLHILKDLGSIKKVEFINEEHSSQQETGALVVQTEDKIFVQSISTGKVIIVTDTAAPIMIQRGYNSLIYYVDHTQPDMILRELKLTNSGHEWKQNSKEIFVVREGGILAVEMDQMNIDKIDSSYTFSNKVKEENLSAVNMLYLMDDKENLVQIRQKEQDESGDPYEVVKEMPLTDLKGFNIELQQYKEKKFNSIVVTDRVISINATNYNFFNGKKWEFNEVPKFDKNKGTQNKVKEYLIDTDEEKENDGKGKNETTTVYVEQIQGIPWTTRLIMTCQFVTKIEGEHGEEDKFQSTDKFITKILPGSRSLDLVGLKGLRDTESVNMIADDLCLYKLRSTNVSGNQDYWTLIDNFGQIRPLPKFSEQLLTWCNFSFGQSKLKNTGTTLVLRGGERSVISTSAFSEFTESVITVIEFNREGQVMYFNKFDKDSYSSHLTELIQRQLQQKESELMMKSHRQAMWQPQDFLQPFKSKLWKHNQEPPSEELKKTASTLQLSEQTLCTSEGDLYRIATIVNELFDSDSAINPIEEGKWKKSGKVQTDKLTVGVFTVDPDLDFKQDFEKLKRVEKNLKIILFMCENEQDRFLLHNSTIAVVGNYFCWSYPQEKGISIINLDEMNKLKPQTTGRGSNVKEVVQSLSNSHWVESNRAHDSQKVSPMNVSEEAKEVHQGNGNSGMNSSRVGEKIKLTPRIVRQPLLNTSFPDSRNQIEASRYSQTFDDDQSRHDYDSNQTMGHKKSLKKSDSTRELRGINEEANSNETSYAGKSSSSQGDNDVTLLNWIVLQSRQINLNDFHVEEVDSIKMMISEVPPSTTFSVIRANPGTQNKLKENLLQVTVQDRVIIFDIAQDKPKEIFFMNATSQLITPERYVNPGIRMAQCITIEQAETKDHFIFMEVKQNRRGDFNLITQERKIYSKSIDLQKTERTNVCKEVFKTYAEVDLQELVNITNRIENHNKIQNIDMQTILSTFDSHTMFSIFDTNVPVHEKLVTQITEEEFSEDEQEDETLLESHKLRRLYRILTLPTPQIIDPQKKIAEIQQSSTKDSANDSAGTKEEIHPSRSESLNRSRKETEDLKISQQQRRQILLNLDGEAKTFYSEIVNSLSKIKEERPDATKQLSDEQEKEREEESKAKLDKDKPVKTGLRSVLLKSLYASNARIKECLLQMVKKCEEGSISSFCENQEDFTRLLEKLTGGTLELIQSGFLSTPFTVQIQSCKWDKTIKRLTFRTKSSLVTQEKVENKVYESIHNQSCFKRKFDKNKEGEDNQDKATEMENSKDGEKPQKSNKNWLRGWKKDLPTTQVKVRMIHLDWLQSDDKNFVDFVGILKKASNEQIYDTELLSSLLCEFWNDNYNKIVYRVMIPWVAYSILVHLFFVYALTPMDYGESFEDRRQTEFILGCSALALLCYQVFVNGCIYWQRASNGQSPIKSYFKDPIEWYQYLSSIFIITINMLEIEVASGETQRVIAAFTTLALWIKVLEWCKLFQPTSVNVRLINETIKDIAFFMIIFVIALAMFGMPMYMLQLNRTVHNPLIDEVFGGVWPLNLLYNQYMMSIGDFSTDTYDDQNPNSELCYVFLVVALFFTSITLLNMLIAVMGDTFGRVTESKERFSLQTKLDIMGDYTAMIKLNYRCWCASKSNKDDKNKIYMFVVTPQMGDDEEDTNWEGNISSIKKSVEKSIAIMGAKVENQYRNVLNQGLETKTRDSAILRGSKENYNKIMVQITHMAQKQELQAYNMCLLTEKINKQSNEQTEMLKIKLESQESVIKSHLDSTLKDIKNYVGPVVSNKETGAEKVDSNNPLNARTGKDVDQQLAGLNVGDGNDSDHGNARIEVEYEDGR